MSEHEEPSSTTTPATVGELLFVSYLQAQGIAFAFEMSRSGKNKMVDFTVPFEGAEYLFECKDFEKADPKLGPGFIGFFDPVEPVRIKIDAARRKFAEYDEFPCSLVLYNVRLLTLYLEDAASVFSAMHGNLKFGFLVNTQSGAMVPGTETSFFGEGGKMTPPGGQIFHTRINAIIVLREVQIGLKRHVEYLSQFHSSEWYDRLSDEVPFDPKEQGLGVIVYENKDAARPLSRGLFRGPYDERWSYDGAAIESVFRGEGVLEVLDLERRAEERADEIRKRLKENGNPEA